MSHTPENPTPPTDDPPPGSELQPAAPRRVPGRLRTPSLRVTAALAAGMLGVGVAVGAAIGPAPQASYAGAADSVAQRLPLLLATLADRGHSTATAQPPAASTAASEPPPIAKQETPAPTSTVAAPASRHESLHDALRRSALHSEPAPAKPRRASSRR